MNRPQEDGPQKKAPVEGKSRSITSRLSRIVADARGRLERIRDKSDAESVTHELEPARFAMNLAYRAVDVMMDDTPEQFLAALQNTLRQIREIVYSNSQSSGLATFCLDVLDPQFFALSKALLVGKACLDDYLYSCLKFRMTRYLEDAGEFPAPIVQSIAKREFSDFEEPLEGIASLKNHLFVLQAFHESLFRYFQKEYKPVAKEKVLKHSVVLHCGRDPLESETLRRDLGRWLLETPAPVSSTKDYLPETLDPRAINLVDQLLPARMESLALFDTRFFLQRLLESVQYKYRHSPSDFEAFRVSDVLQHAEIHGLDRRYLKVSGALKISRLEDGNVDKQQLCVKDVLLWRRFHSQEYYESLRDEEFYEFDESDEDSHCIQEYHVMALVTRLHKVILQSSSIEEVFETLVPDLPVSVFVNPGTSAVQRRLDRLAAVGKIVLQDKPKVQFLLGFSSFLKMFSGPEWRKKNSTGMSNFATLQVLAQKCFPTRTKEESSRQQAYEDNLKRMEDRWEVLDKPAGEVSAGDSLLMEQMVRRLTGWRKIQRDLRVRALRDVMNQMGWNVDDAVVDDGDDGSQLIPLYRFYTEKGSPYERTLTLMLGDLTHGITVNNFKYLSR